MKSAKGRGVAGTVLARSGRKSGGQIAAQCGHWETLPSRSSCLVNSLHIGYTTRWVCRVTLGSLPAKAIRPTSKLAEDPTKPHFSHCRPFGFTMVNHVPHTEHSGNREESAERLAFRILSLILRETNGFVCLVNTDCSDVLTRHIVGHTSK